MPFRETCSRYPVLSSYQAIDKSSGEAQCSGGSVLQHLALNPHIARTCGPVSILAAVPQAIRQIWSFAVLVACSVLPVVLADQINLPDFENLLKEGQSFHFSERYKDAIKTLLPLFEQKGCLDFETV